MVTIHWDSWDSVEAALQAGLGRAAAADGGSLEAQRAPRLAIACFADAWAPSALATAAAAETVRTSGDVRAFAQLFVLDAGSERDRVWEMGILATPTLLFFWDGQVHAAPPVDASAEPCARRVSLLTQGPDARPNCARRTAGDDS